MKLWHTEMIEGSPIPVGEKTLTPVARVVSFGRRQATVGTRGMGGYGGGLVWIKPVAVVEHSPDGTRRLPIPDATGAALLRLFTVALLIPLVCWLMVRIVEQLRSEP